MAIEFVDLHIKNGDFPLLFICLPEGTRLFSHVQTMKTSPVLHLRRHGALPHHKELSILAGEIRQVSWGFLS